MKAWAERHWPLISAISSSPGKAVIGGLVSSPRQALDAPERHLPVDNCMRPRLFLPSERNVLSGVPRSMVAGIAG